MSVWSDINKRSQGHQVKKEDINIVFSDALNYTEEAKEDIRNTIRNLHISSVIFPLKESSTIGKSVYVSEERKTYQSLFKERFGKDMSDWDKLEVVLVLGEYASDKRIILYINNIIREIEDRHGDLMVVMRYVYLHELMHAYFDRNEGHRYIYGIEEAFAEFGALYCLGELVDNDKADSSELDWALSHVSGKKDVLRSYSYGYDLFKRYENEMELAKTLLKSYI